MGSVYPKGNRLYFKVKVDGVWRNIRTEFVVGQERQARAVLDRLEERRAAGVESVGDLGPVTVSTFSKVWMKEREKHVRTWKNDDSVMRIHVLPMIGSLRLDEVRAKHLVDLVKTWRTKPADERLAPKSIYNAYSTVSALFRDAELEGLIDSSPCKLTKRQLGPKVDADPEWRPTAKYSLAELEMLISDERVPMDRRVLYALEGIAGVRHGEAAGLHFRNCDAEPKAEPLGMLYIAFNYEHPLPKGDVCRPVPIHPTLAAILAEWKLHGWARMMGRQPTPDDLVLPLPPQAKSKYGRWRRKGYSYDGLERDLEALGLRHRRGHDLRRTMISLCRANGAVRDILRRATHKPPKEVIEGYTTFEWEVVCAEVAKHPIRRPSTAEVISLPRAVNAGSGGLVPGLVPDQPSPQIRRGAAMALPGLEQSRGGGAEADSGASGESLPRGEGQGEEPPRSNDPDLAHPRGTKVPSLATVARRALSALEAIERTRAPIHPLCNAEERAAQEAALRALRELIDDLRAAIGGRS